MAIERPSSYAPLSTRDVDDPETLSNTHEPEDYVQNPTSNTEAPNVPSIDISPPPSPPIRAQTDDSFASAATQPLSREDLFAAWLGLLTELKPLIPALWIRHLPLLLNAHLKNGGFRR